MKSSHIILLTVASFGLASCLPLPVATQPDDADMIVGKYNYTDNYYLKWGSGSKSDTYNGSFTLTKISVNKVRMTGDWSTTGTITGNTIQFDFCPQNDSKGYYNYTFGAGIASSSNMTFTYTCTGARTADNGVSYQWDCNGNVYAWKVE